MALHTPLAFEINLCPDGLVFDVGSLFKAFSGLHDQRDGRALRNALVTVLSYIVLAKLPRQDQSHGIVQLVLGLFYGKANAMCPALGATTMPVCRKP